MHGAIYYFRGMFTDQHDESPVACPYASLDSLDELKQPHCDVTGIMMLRKGSYV